jgi:hypothetical protein
MTIRGRGTAVLIALVVLVLSAAAGAGGADGHGKGNAYGRDGVRPVPADVKVEKTKKVKAELAEQAQALGAEAAAADATSKTPPLGTVRPWVATRFDTGGLFLTNATLRGVGEKIEVWVQNNRSFPAGDCRNTNPVDLEITDAQVQSLITSFDTKMFPIESKLFSVAPDRDGEHNLLGLDYSGDGDKIVTLVMNIRDENYLDMNNANGFGYVVGYFSSGINDYHDRNTMTIDAFDWVHRMGATPANEPVTGTEAACKSRPAFPYRMESTFAHEYQHLIEHYASTGETNWVNEGLSDYAMRKTGFARPEIAAGTVGSEGHVQCFYGNLGSTLGGVPFGGAENSLTWWEDQGGGEVLCDYGAAWSMMEYLEGQFGEAFLTALHNEDRNGLDGLQAVLDQFLTGRTSQEVVHDYLASVAVDSALDEGKARGGASDGRYSIPTLSAAINLDSVQSYGSPGAPPNGADYVRLRDAAGGYLTGRQISSLSFSGQQVFPSDPVAWKVVDGALSAELTTDLANNMIIRPITVPASTPTLTFRGKYDLEEHWDFGFVQISTDNGETYKSLACSNTNSDNVPNAHPLVLQYVPGYSGVSDWRNESCDLAAYAGQTVLLAFRGVTDWGTIGNDGETANDGWFVDDIAVGGTPVSDGTTLAGWKSETEVNPIEVAGWTIQLVGYSADKKQVVVSRVPIGADFTTSLSGGALQRLLGNQTDVVAALVTYDEPTEAIQKYARYELRVNGTLQPGG